jgi:hypothetical protein
MAARWQAAGNVAKLEFYPEGPHLFFRLPSAMATEAAAESCSVPEWLHPR